MALADPTSLFRPTRTRLVEAVAAVLDERVERVREVLAHDTPVAWLLNGYRNTITERSEAWETLASRGVIPLEWVGDERRRFAWARDQCLACDAMHRPILEGLLGGGPSARCNTCGAMVPRVLPCPPTIVACVTLASDPSGVTTAEAMAREIAARSAAGTANEALVWRVARADEAGSVRERFGALVAPEPEPTARRAGSRRRRRVTRPPGPSSLPPVEGIPLLDLGYGLEALEPAVRLLALELGV